MLTTLLAFLVTLAILIVIHEYGHYRVAVACGVKVLRFSVGFGPVLKRWQRGETEFVLSAFPLGGYVRMVDEREAPVPEADLPRAFNRQPLGARAAVVAAGPAANLVLAVLLYSLMFWIGVQDVKPLLAQPLAGTPAAAAGLKAGDWVHQASLGAPPSAHDWSDVVSMDDLSWYLTRAAVDHQPLYLRVSSSQAQQQREVKLDLSGLGEAQIDQNFMRRVGLQGVYSPPVVGHVEAGGAAQRAGLQTGDFVMSVDGQPVSDAADLRARILASKAGDTTRVMHWRVRRGDRVLDVDVQPALVTDQGQTVARILAMLGSPPQLVEVRYGPVEGVVHAVRRTYDICALNLEMMGRLLIGQASVKNLGGAISIADMAGQAVRLGPDVYLGFLAAMSAMLGILNLLPLPVLDGGHLMYYLFEAVTGRAVSGVWLERLQRGGLAVLLLMMSLALYNDIVRLVGAH
jgi:regulator of sigma E protease